MGWLRLSTRLGAFVLFLAATTALAASLLLAETVTGKVVDRPPWSRFCFRWACRCLGLRIRQHGAPCQDNALLVCNHISWSDIPVLGSLQPIRFLSKAEVSRWPLIGWLARQAGTLFIVRGGGQARKVRRQIADTLSAGETVLVFPEGTTSAGLTVLPFHGLLLQAAATSGKPVQPLTIAYRRAGRPDHLAPFVGDDAFHRHLLRMLSQPAARVDVVFHQPVQAPQATNSEFAAQLRLTVSQGLASVHRGELDERDTDTIRTAAGPAQSRHPSLPGGRQSPDRSTG